MSRKRYRVWRAVIKICGRHITIRCMHDTDNLQEIRQQYMKQFRISQSVLLYYTEFK